MAVRSLAEAFIRIRPDFSQFQAETRGGLMAGLGGGLTGLLGGLIAGFGALAGAATVFGVKGAAATEQAKVGFTTLLHSQQAAMDLLSQLTAFAARTPFTLPGVRDAARLLLGAGAAAKDIIPDLTALGDASGALGLGQEQFSRILVAWSQSMAAGKINAQDMNQMIQAGLPIWKLMSEATGKSVAELRDLSSQGKLMSGDVLPKLLVQMEKDYGGAMGAQAKTLNGLWSTLTDTISIALQNAVAPLIPALKAGAAALIEFSSHFPDLIAQAEGKAGPALRAFAGVFTRDVVPALKTIGGVIANDVIPAAHNLLVFIAPLLPPAEALAKALLGVALFALPPLGVSLKAVTGFMAEHRTAILAVTIIVGTFLALINAAVAAQILWATVTGIAATITGGFATAMAILNAIMALNPIFLVVIALAALVAGFIFAYKNSETFRRIVNATFGAVVTAGKAVVDFIVNHWRLLAIILLGPFGLLLVWVITYWHQIYTVISTVVTAIVNFVTDHWRLLLQLLFPIIGTIVVLFIDHFGQIRNVVSAAVNAISGFLHRLAGPFADAGRYAASFASNTLRAADDAARYVGSLPGRIGGVFKGAGGWLIHAGEDIVHGLVKGIENGFGWVQKKLGELAGKIPGWKGPPATDEKILVPAGQLVMRGFMTGIESEFSALASLLGGVGSSLQVGSPTLASAPAAGPSRMHPADLAELRDRPMQVQVYLDGKPWDARIGTQASLYMRGG